MSEPLSSPTQLDTPVTVDAVPTDTAPLIGFDVPTAGSKLGRYVVLETLGSGGMGVVLRAYDPRLEREVALKRLRSDVLEPRAAERMVREAQAMAQLAHPNVVAVYDVEPLESTVLLVMELVRGRTLGMFLREEQPPWPQVLDLFLQAGRGLAAAHAASLVHRDFKPPNVLVGDDGRVRVTDFGLARPVGERLSADDVPSASSHSLRVLVTAAGAVMGTPAYMAPEQHVGEDADASADQYAFCVSLWESLPRDSNPSTPFGFWSKRLGSRGFSVLGSARPTPRGPGPSPGSGRRLGDGRRPSKGAFGADQRGYSCRGRAGSARANGTTAPTGFGPSVRRAGRGPMPTAATGAATTSAPAVRAQEQLLTS